MGPVNGEEDAAGAVDAVDVDVARGGAGVVDELAAGDSALAGSVVNVLRFACTGCSNAGAHCLETSGDRRACGSSDTENAQDCKRWEDLPTRSSAVPQTWRPQRVRFIDAAGLCLCAMHYLQPYQARVRQSAGSNLCRTPVCAAGMDPHFCQPAGRTRQTRSYHY